MWSVTCAKTPLFTVFCIHREAKTTANSEVLKFTGPKTALFIVFLQCFYALRGRNHCKANSDVFELAVAQNTAIYSFVFFLNTLSKNHSYLRRFHQHIVAENTTICEFFFAFSRNIQKQCKNQYFCPTKTAKTIPQRAPKS